MSDERLKSWAEHHNFRYLNLLLVVLFSALLVLSAFFVSKQRNAAIASALGRISQEVARNLAEAMELSVESLRSASNFIVFFESATYQQFLNATSQNFEAEPGLLLIEWQPVVPESQRAQFEAAARERGLPDFRLWEPDELGNPMPAQARPEHVPVFFMHARYDAPQAASTLGLDLAWSRERMASKWEARDLGRARASSLFEVVTSAASEYRPLGFAITLPVYLNGYAPEGLSARREELRGYMAGVYDLEKLLKARSAALLAGVINLEMHDGPPQSGGDSIRVVIDSGWDTILSNELQLELYGGKFHLVLGATDAFAREQFQWLWLSLPAAVILCMIMTFVFLLRLESGHRRLAEAQVKLRKLNTKLRDLSLHDPLTGLFNRRAFEEKLNQEIERVDREEGSASVLMLDLDHFKQINDAWGHTAGDTVLKEVALRCQETTRNFDLVARFGGEEFAIVLANADSEEAYRFGERLRALIADTPFKLGDSATEIHVSVSVGISTASRRIAPNTLVEQADLALYLAKTSGRNCVRVFES